MRHTGPASLTGALLSGKGGSTHVGFLPAGNIAFDQRMNLGEPIAVLGPASPPGHAAIAAPASASRRLRHDNRIRQSVMLDEDRHYRLRLAAARLRSNARTLMVDALDHYLATVVPARVGTDCHCLQPAADCGHPDCPSAPESRS